MTESAPSNTRAPNELLDVEPQSYPVPSNGKESNNIGVAVEDFAARFWSLDHERSQHHDAREPVTDWPVQTKGARWRSCNGHRNGRQLYAHGRFRLFEADHEWLMENNGVYAFVVYEKPDDMSIIVPVYARMMKPSTLDDWILNGEPWYSKTTDVMKRKEYGTDYRLPWPDVFPSAGGSL